MEGARAHRYSSFLLLDELTLILLLSVHQSLSLTVLHLYRLLGPGPFMLRGHWRRRGVFYLRAEVHTSLILGKALIERKIVVGIRIHVLTACEAR